MLLFYKFGQRIVHIIINFLFVIQITLMILVFLTATYWFLNLLGFGSFDFVAPLANKITEIVHIFCNQEVQIGGVFFDGALLLFDLIAVCLVFGATKLKVNLLGLEDNIIDSIRVCEERIEDRFNEKLQKEVRSNIIKCNNTAILVQFTAKSMLVDAFWGGDEKSGVQEKEDEAFKEFYTSLKAIPGCKFAKTDNKMLILCDDFNKVDSLMRYIDVSINRIKNSFLKKKWRLYSYVAIDVYDDNTPFKEVYPILEKLLLLKNHSEAVCLGNFCMRYELAQDNSYEPMLKGTYSIGEETEVWMLVKKN
ncbi:MAG: hypothetical protein ACLSWI_06690 [Candidatus Gastranaerophilaceae bacterium]